MHDRNQLSLSAAIECPRSYKLLNSLPKESIMTWLCQYGIGREALRALERKLNERLS